MKVIDQYFYAVQSRDERSFQFFFVIKILSVTYQMHENFFRYRETIEIYIITELRLLDATEC